MELSLAWRGIPVALASALLVSCEGGPNVLIGQLDVAPFKCQAQELQPGPNDYQWCTFADTGTSSNWIGVSAAAAHVTASAPADLAAGMVAAFDSHWTVRDLSGYETIRFRATVPAGTRFEVFVGQGPNNGCSYVETGTGEVSQSYSVDLRRPIWCSPTFCGYDLRASGIAFSTYVRRGSTLDIDLTELKLVKSPVGRTNSVFVFNAAYGPGGYCWFPFNWGEGNKATLQSPPTESSVEVFAEGPAQSVVGMAFELPQSNFNISDYKTLEISGTFDEKQNFMVQLVRGNRGATWSNLVGTGRPEVYSIDLTRYDSTFPANNPFKLTEALRVELSKPYLEATTFHAVVTDARFSP